VWLLNGNNQLTLRGEAMKYLIIICAAVVFGCATTTTPILTDINPISELIYLQHSKIDVFTRHYYVKSEGCTGVAGNILVQSIWAIPGVSAVYPSPYKLSVAICPIYSWGDIEPEIISRINQLIEAYEAGKQTAPQVDKSGGA
jgi:hypothetical protein